MAANTSINWNRNKTMNMDDVTETAVKSKGFGPEELNTYGLYRAGNELLGIQITICCIIGLPSNLASIITLIKMKPMTSSTFYLTLLAFVDFFVLFYKQVFVGLINDDDYQVGEAGCRAYFYLGSVSVHYSVWLIVALTVERFIAVWFPLRVATFCTVFRAKVTSVCILVVLALLDLVYAIATTEVISPGGLWRCSIHQDYGNLITKWAWVDTSIYLFLSWPTLLICNILIIVGLRMSARRKIKLTNSSGQSDETKRQQKSVTIMLITVSVACFVLLSPNAILYVYEQYWDYSSEIGEYVKYSFLNNFVFFVSNLNHAINFWLYVISGRRFRRVFLALITCRSVDEALSKKTSVATAVSSVSTNSKRKYGNENGAYENNEENHL